jgi:hypothetical protein
MSYTFSSARDIIGERTQQTYNNSSNSGNFKKATFVNFSLAKSTESKITHKVRLVGLPYSYIEYGSYKYDNSEKGKTVLTPFTDTEFNNRITRIGHEDPNQCPWKKLGYVGVQKYAQNCFIRNDEGTWELAILTKGKSVFRPIAEWEVNRYDESMELDEDERQDFSTLAGGHSAPCFRITARKTGLSGPKSIEYSVSADSKDVTLTQEMLAELKMAASNLSDDDIAQRKAEYNKYRTHNTYLPEWQEHFAWGFQLDKMFKFTPVMTEPAPVREPYKAEAPKPSKPVEEVVVEKPVAKPKPQPQPESDDDSTSDEEMNWD